MTVLDPRGGSAQPWTNAELIVKFHRLTERAWDRAGAAEWARQCLGLPSFDGALTPWAAQAADAANPP